MSTPWDWIAQASRVIGVPLTPNGYQAANGPCPRCRTGTNRLVVWAEGNYWCRRCHVTGYWLPKAETQANAHTSRVEQAEQQQRLQASMGRVTVWQDYQRALFENGGDRLALWLAEGMSERDVIRWGLGYCNSTPLAPGRASLTLPVFRVQRLVDIRYRLLDGTQGDKYRSHLAGLRASLFNLDGLHADKTVLVVEGEKKAIHAVNAGFPASLGLPGAQFGGELLQVVGKLLPGQRVVLALDPDQGAEARNLAGKLAQAGVEVWVADFPLKPDDLSLGYGSDMFGEVIKQARRIT